MGTSDGGPAFPHSIRDRVGMETHEAATFDGMTLRDYFAAKALPVVIDAVPTDKVPRGAAFDIVAEVIAKYAYLVADAMLAERSK